MDRLSRPFDGYLVLIGPIGVGKTPIAATIAERLSLPHLLLDLADEVRARFGWDMEKEYQASRGGVLRHIEYLAQFTMPTIEYLMTQHDSAVIDCGGTDLVGTTKGECLRLQAERERLGLKNIAAILPFDSVSRSRAFFARRRTLSELDEILISSPAYAEIAQGVFYTRGRQLVDVADEIIAWARRAEHSPSKGRHSGRNR